MSQGTETEGLLDRVYAGEIRAIARMMSLAEGARTPVHGVMGEIYRRAGQAHVVGVTGVPGSGKSTLVGALTRAVRKSGRKVGIVAVDPSSPFSGGAILGDRIRMADLAMDEGVFIRSLATRGNLGGLASASLDTVDILDVAGFDLVLIETVGVGQDEVDIARAAHTVVVVSPPGLGDDVQAIKAGVLEIADIHVVSKADRPDANKTASDLKAMLGLGLSGRDRGIWSVPVICTSVETGEGLESLSAAIDDHSVHLTNYGERGRRQHEIAEMRILKIVENMVRRCVEGGRETSLKTLFDDTASRRLDPYSAARKLLQNVKIFE